MIWLLPIPATALLGVVLLWVGVRGRRVDDHPICRNCGFDLFGRPQSSERCAECGALLSGRRAMVDGRRVRRGGMIASGAVALALGLTAGGGVGYVARGITDWQPYKPGWWLLRELDHPASRAAAIKELSSRQASFLLTQPQVDTASDKLLNFQADPKQMWLTSAGDFLEGARARGQLSDDRWHRYGRQAVQLALDVRPWVRRGDVIPFQVRDTGVTRAGSRPRIAVRPYANVIVGGESFGVRELRDTTQELTAPAAAMRGDVPARDYVPRLPDGPMPVRVTVDLEWQRSLHLLPRLPLTPIELTGELKMFPAHESTVLVRYDEALEPTMRNAVRVLELRRGYPPGSITGVIVECMAPPVGVAFGVFVQMNGTWTSCGVITCPPNETRQFNLTMSGGAGITNDRVVRVMFFPAPVAAAGSTDSFEVWNAVIEKTTAGRTSDGFPTPRPRTSIVTTRPRPAGAR